ncbi:hypothetical protein TIFTF001_040954 [Ficus carica]|uniref:R13L1/DRL21-like LRR repeat region domain-containing protein n=1 Tax=Ficus carica TaxID=3494 RepID=A0AA87Z084_FICCA|nr:hypothetical protein TIFTF001_040949 [Ficus carica]GMN27001.1 hypothetical protein TIFTF001_040954 [Ficus carica]
MNKQYALDNPSNNSQPIEALQKIRKNRRKYRTNTEASRSESENGHGSSISQVIEANMVEILDRLKFLVEEKNFLGLKKGVQERPSRRLLTTSLVDESSVYGVGMVTRSLKLNCCSQVRFAGTRSLSCRKSFHIYGKSFRSRDFKMLEATDTSVANLKEMKGLLQLSLKWVSDADDSQREREVLDGLKPTANLNKLFIHCCGGTRFPAWLGEQFRSMVSTYLRNCRNCSLIELEINGFDGVKLQG